MRYLVLFFAVFFAACSVNSKQISEQTKIKTEPKHYAALDFEQNISLLVRLKEEFQNEEKAYKKRFFSAWHSDFKKINPKDLFYSFNAYLDKNNTYYFFNKQIIPKIWFEKNIDNANITAFGSVNKKALITKNTLLKNFPTQSAVLKDPFKEGEGIPFDYTLNSVLNAGNAVLISHFSKDKKYAFVKYEAGFGFVESEALEIFSEERTKIYENLKFITPLYEEMSVLNEKDEFFFETRIGAIYPYYKSDESFYYGKIGKHKYKIPKDKVAVFPLKFNDTHLKHQLSELLNIAYGWGGYALKRDCSLLMRDIFAPFGIYLPRNSLAQNNAFTHFDISFLNNEQKKELIKNFAKPYLTLLYLKGHIMLYVGISEEKELAFHSIWGLRLSEDKRLLLSRSVISSLEIAKDEIKDENLLLSRLKELSFISLSESEKKALQSYLLNFKKE